MIDLGKIGVWSAGLRFGPPEQALELAAELEELGYGALWVPGGAAAGTLDSAAALLDATENIPVATGIVNIWVEDAAGIAEQTAALRAAHPDRFLLGVGISHGPLIGDRYEKPLTAMRAYLDGLDEASPDAGPDARVIAAIGPRMLELARERSLGTHPYLMPPEHTAIAREALGEGKIVAPEQTVVLESDPGAARAAAREFLQTYTGLPNYMNTLKRIAGLDDGDIADGGSDRLVDTAIAWGDEEAIGRRVQGHLDAGADHVCIQVAAAWDELPADALRRLAAALL